MTRDQLFQALSFPFAEPGWPRKFLLAYLAKILFFLIVPLVLYLGYLERLAQQVLEEGRAHLPEWEPWEELLARGVRWLVALFLLFLPLSLSLLLSAGLWATMFLTARVEELGLVSPEYELFPVIVTVLAQVGLALFTVPYVLTLALLAPPALMHMVAQQRLSALWAYKEWWPIFRASWEHFLIALVVVIGLQAVYWLLVAPWSWMLFPVLPLLSAAVRLYLTLVAVALFAQAYRAGRQAVSEASEEV